MDEIGTLNLTAQAKLLRVLQEKEIERIGGMNTIKVDVRIITATNKPLEKALKESDFREDLYYRLNIFPIYLPPLREKKTDILLLADYFLEKYSKKYKKDIRRISTPAIDMLMRYHWPGNVRELENVIERAVVIGKKRKITPADLPFQDASIPRKPIEGSLGEVEKDHISDMLTACEWNIARTASLLGINRTTLYKKIKKYELKQLAS